MFHVAYGGDENHLLSKSEYMYEYSWNIVQIKINFNGLVVTMMIIVVRMDDFISTVTCNKWWFIQMLSVKEFVCFFCDPADFVIIQ